MAQWKGQFSGLTHTTKVDDNEEMLREAISAYIQASDAEKSGKAKKTRKLAERLLASRLKAIRAQRAELTEPHVLGMTDEQLNKLSMRACELRTEGVDGILKEFHFAESV